MTRDELSKISMMIITYAGTAKSLIFEAIVEYKKGNKELALKNINEAEENLKFASQEHFKALTADAESPVKVDILYVHAEDQLMSADTILLLTKTIFNID